MKMFDLLRRGAAIAPDNIAIRHGQKEVNYRELLNQSSDIGDYLRTKVGGTASRIAILSDNAPEYVSFLFGIFAADHIAVPLDNSQTPDKIGEILADCRASALYIQSKFLKHLEPILQSNRQISLVISDATVDVPISGIQVILLNSIVCDPPAPGRYQIALSGIESVVPLNDLSYDNRPELDSSPAAIFYTSGSTGAGKGVVLSHRNLISNTIGTVDYLLLDSDDSVIVILPFYYIYGNSLLLTHILVGGTLVLDNRFAFPQAVLNTMKETGVTGFSGVPSNFMILLNNSEFQSRSFPELRYLTQAGGGLSPDLIKKVAKRFSDKELFIMYGQTEASPRISWLPPDRLKDKLGSVGIPVPGVTFRIVDEDGTELPDGHVGEVTIAGDNVMLGYYGNAEEQAQTLRDGWLYTGDLGYLDDEGFLFIQSRKKQIIKVGGFRVSAREVEECILLDQRVLEVAVIGMPDPVLGEALKAVVVLKEKCAMTEKEIKDHCQVHLSQRKTPSHVQFLKSLPKLKSGKVDRSRLK